MNSHQELIDRLVIATEEQDVLWVLVMLEQMKELGCLHQAINEAHSWKGYSAFGSISRLSSLSTLHRFIAQLLLLNRATSTETGQNVELSEVANRWNEEGRGKAQDAQHVLSLSLEDAADWIDSNLPSLPNPESLTGGGPLPVAPSRSASIDPHVNSSNVAISAASKDFFSESSRQETNLYSLVPQEEVHFAAVSVHSLLTSSHFELTVKSNVPSADPSQLPNLLPKVFTPNQGQPSEEEESNTVTLHVARLPLRFKVWDVVKLFADIGVEVEDPRLCSTDSARNFGFVGVKACDVEKCILNLNKKAVEGGTIHCGLAKHAAISRSRPSVPSSFPNQPLPPTPSRYSPPSDQIRSDSRRPCKRSYEEEEEADQRSSRSLVESPRLSTPNWNDAPPSSELTALHIAGLPPHFGTVEIVRLFRELGVNIYNVSTGSKPNNRFASVDVESLHVQHVIKCFGRGAIVGGHQISCYVSRPLELRHFLPSFRANFSAPSNQSSLTTLHVAGLPPRFHADQLAQLFSAIGVVPRAIRHRSNGPREARPFGFVDVESSDVDHCLTHVDGQLVQGIRIACYISKEPSRYSAPRRPLAPRPPCDLRQPPSPTPSEQSRLHHTLSSSSERFAPSAKRVKH